MAIARRKASTLKKFYLGLVNDKTQPVDVRLKAAARLQKIYEQEPTKVPAPKPMTVDDARAAIAAVTKGNANAQA